MKNSILFLIILALYTSYAQFQEQKKTEFNFQIPQLGEKLKIENLYQQPLQIFDPSLISLEGPVDPKSYIVGPGDVLSINIWISPPLSYLVQVTVEGTVIIPTVGEVKVAGLTLSKAKKLIIEKIRKKYISGEITATLTLPRTFLVTVTGHVLNPGKYRVEARRRVSYAIFLANNPIDSSQIRLKKAVLDSMSLRKIKLIRKGKEIRVDLVKYFATGDDKFNPYLLDGDWIFVPRRDFNSFVSIYGAVNRPGIYEYVEGDSLKDLIQIAGGVLKSADLEHVKISRLNSDGSLKEIIEVNLRKILNGEADDVPLEENDRVIVPEIKTLKRDYKVYVQGEVEHPGVYPISINGTKLSEVLKLAGVNKYSALNRAIIVRNRSDFKLIKSVYPLLLLKGFGLAQEDSVYLRREFGVLRQVKFVSVDLNKVLDGEDDYELRDGDLIYIPTRTNSVYVFGQVKNPGFVDYEPGKDYKFYIKKAGGFSQLARKGDVKVIKGKTFIWYDADEVKIEPGDYILVPKKIIRPTSYYINLIRDAILAVGSVASVIATILLIQERLKR